MAGIGIGERAIDGDADRLERACLDQPADHSFAYTGLLCKFAHQPLGIDQCIQCGRTLRGQPCGLRP